MSGRNAMLKPAFWILAVCALGVLAAGYVPAAPWSRRAATAQETALYYFAQQLGEPALCGRISWDASRSQGGWFKGGISRLRSECYERVAEARHDETLCWQARPFFDLDPSSAGYSAFACSRRTQAGYHASFVLPDAALVQAFRTLGYDLDDMHLEGVVQPPVRPADTYMSLVNDPAAVTRAKELLGRGGPEPADRAYLADLAALGSGDAGLCASIPVSVLSVHQQAPLRDWCYFTVAYNRGDARLCAAMTPAAKEPKVMAAEASGVQPGIAEGMSLHAQCIKNGGYGAQRQYRFGPELPTSTDQVERILTALGATPQRAADWPVAKQAAYLRDVVTVLAVRTPPDAARDAARALLLQRLQAMPL